MQTAHRPTSRALFGTMALIVLIFVYVIAAAGLATMMLPSESGVVHFFYYAIAGLAWVPAAGLIIRWMYPRRGLPDGGNGGGSKS
ncbi:MAG: DUF2842 domain-containing protein [Hyphomicrobiaceae bacterium]